eukprot:TRINITY_DN6161_c0_g1_i1.p1 TRINITY_DN6161_c0_g1~~TRINITY_DN6161_c0_g1_i1.p1  ORF type:complete len:201 (+),score=6.62 TRINITY_DN6161_c0_g1_i1:3-605(+)
MKSHLLAWVKGQLRDYDQVEISLDTFSSSWSDGTVLMALLDSLTCNCISTQFSVVKDSRVFLVRRICQDKTGPITLKTAVDLAEDLLGIPKICTLADLLQNETKLLGYLSLFWEFWNDHQINAEMEYDDQNRTEQIQKVVSSNRLVDSLWNCVYRSNPHLNPHNLFQILPIENFTPDRIDFIERQRPAFHTGGYPAQMGD